MNERHMAYVCMGSNMGEPETNLARAREVLGSCRAGKSSVVARVFYGAAGYARPAWFANQVLKVSCALDMTAPIFGYAA